MSSDRRFSIRTSARIAAMLATAFGLAAAPALAQRATSYDALRDYWVQRSAVARTRLAEYRQRVNADNLDTVRTPLLEIVGSRDLSHVAAELARLSDSVASRGWTLPAAGSLPRFEIRKHEVTAAADIDPATVAPPEDSYELWLHGPNGSGRSLTFFKAGTASEGAAMMVRAGVFEPALQSLAPELREWMGLTPPAERPNAGEWAQGYRDLATYPSLPSRACLVGDLGACETTLALRDEPNPIEAWYDLGLRQTLAARWLAGYRSGRDAADTVLVRSCVNGSESACRRFLSEPHLGASMIEPGAKQLRGLLVRYAFSLATDSVALRRASFATGLSIPERFAVAAGRPYVEVIRGFHRELVAHQPQPVAPAATLLWAGAFWFAAFGALSLRSSRWRG